jgi:NADH-quinone oxidoreductase subunit N
MPNFLIILPEIFLLSMICVILLLDLVFKSKALVYYSSQASLVILTALTLHLFKLPVAMTFDNSFVLDPLASLLKILIYITNFLVFWMARDYVAKREMPFTEYYLLALFATLGMMLLVSSHNFIVLFLALELSALPVYAMVALWNNSPFGAEASIKYFVMGALASGILLYGLSMIYGATGSLDMSAISQSSHDLLLLFALVFIITGIAFKFGAAPFHLWVPDVYTGAPTAVTLFLSAAPKIAALGMAFRLLADALPTLEPQWQMLLIVVAIASMALGNFAAIVQTNLKRMLAYSSIAHMGYMVLGLTTGNVAGYSSAVFYMLAYTLMSLGAFGLLVILSKAGVDFEEMTDLRGLNARNPWLAFMMLLMMFSMAGIPPTVGFFAKMGVLEALIGVHLVWLAVLALIFAIIGAYYYINIVKIMYFEDPDVQAPFQFSGDLRIAISVSGLAVLMYGIVPSTVINLCRQVFI